MKIQKFGIALVVVAGLFIASPSMAQRGPGKGPMGKSPMGKSPMGKSPMGKAPMGNVPMAKAPMGQGPMGQGPMGQGPMGQGPMGQGPMAKGPMGDGPMGQGPMGKGPMGKNAGGDAAFAADRNLFHQLLHHRADIRRDVKKTDNGVETLTESDKPEVAATIQNHVASMEKRVKEKQPIHLRDPLFAEVFRNSDKIKFVYEKTEKGMRVTETSEDAYTVKLIQAHADVVSLFLKNGFSEVQKNHALPAKP
jgi:hypothetical protein